MDGLEIREQLISYLFKNKDFRIDSQFYTKEPIKNPLLKYDKIGHFLEKSQYGISKAMNEDNIGYPIYRMNEIHHMMCDLEVNKFADISSDELSMFRLNDRDVLFNRTNSFEWVGRTGLYKKIDDRDFVFASYLVRFVPDKNYILPEYLTAFLNSKQGILDIKRRARQSINQTNVNPEEVKEIEIPLISMEIQKNIKNLFEIANKKRILSDKFYKEAEKLLLNDLDLLGFQPSKEKVTIKSFEESFGESGRLDSEYYLPKYEEIIEKIKSYGSDKLSNVCKIIDKNFSPESDILYTYIELSNIGREGEVTGFTTDMGKNLPSRARRKISFNNVIISSVEGSLDKVALINLKDENLLCSTGFYVIESDIINSETLLVLFKNKVFQQILKQNCSGTILTAINKNEFYNLEIPIINQQIQDQIEQKIKLSFNLKEESKKLLDLAKKTVEIAIEKDENEAMRYIENEGEL